MDIVIEESKVRPRNKDEPKVMKLVNQFETRPVVGNNITKIEESGVETGNHQAGTAEADTTAVIDTLRTNQAKVISIEYRESPKESIPKLSEEIPRMAPKEWSISRLRKPNEVCMCRPGMTCEFCADRLN